MDYKNQLKVQFSDQELVKKYRYDTSKSAFIYLTALFFINYFFVWARFYDEIFLVTLPFSYFSFLVALVLFIFFFINNIYDIKNVGKIFLWWILIVVFLFLSTIFLGISF